jgi:hypothetical protein
MPNTANEQARKDYGTLFDAVSAVLFHHDPIGINFDTNTDEYDPEARTILPRLPSCGSEIDALVVITEVSPLVRRRHPGRQGRLPADSRRHLAAVVRAVRGQITRRCCGPARVASFRHMGMSTFNVEKSSDCFPLVCWGFGVGTPAERGADGARSTPISRCCALAGVGLTVALGLPGPAEDAPVGQGPCVPTPRSQRR